MPRKLHDDPISSFIVYPGVYPEKKKATSIYIHISIDIDKDINIDFIKFNNK